MDELTDNEQLNNAPDNEQSPDDSWFVNKGYSFESILTEVKTSSFIEGDVKTPKHILEAEAERILRQVNSPLLSKTEEIPEDELPPEFKLQTVATEKPAATERTIATEKPPVAEQDTEITHYTPPSPQPQQKASPKFENPFEPETPQTAADRLVTEVYERYDKNDEYPDYEDPDFSDVSAEPMIITPQEDDFEASGVAAFSEAPARPVPMFAEDLPSIDIPIGDTPQDSVEIKPVSGKKDSNTEKKVFILNRKTADSEQEDDERVIPEGIADSTVSEKFNRVYIPDDEEFGREPEEEELFEEPRLKEQAIKFAKTCNSISRRLLPASLITLIMVLITFVFEADMAVPYGIGYNLEYAAGTLVILLLIVMMLCIEILIRGADFLIRGTPNAETLVLFTCVFSLVSAVFTIMSGTAQMLPFCAVSALSLVFATFGERANIRAMTDNLKTVVSCPEPYGVQAEYNENLDKSVLKKAYSRTDGFYINLVQQDISEILYLYVTPALLISVLLMTVVNVLINRAVENSLHILSALLASAAPFSLLLTYSLPFSIVTKAAKKAGVALAGWGGADDIAHTDGVCLTDDDLFPDSTLRLSGIKVFDGAAPNNVLCYTGSLIIASGSGLSNMFANALIEKGITPVRVANFECHESGVSAVVQGHKVYTGSAAYMNLIGVRVPDDSNMKNAIFTAVNGRLVAMFTVDYKPLPGVQGAIISMLKWRIDLFFAMRDFNITPSMVGQKFKVPFDGFVFMPVKDSYAISDPYSGKQGRMAAVLTRESFGPYAEAITSARLLRSTSLFATILSVITAGLGVFLMFLMLWDGSFFSATPSNLIIYGFCMLLSVFVVCGYIRIRK